MRRTIRLIAALTFAGAASGGAQALPDVGAAKRAAQRSADAASARVAAQTGQAVPRSGPGSVPAVPTPRATSAPGADASAARTAPVTREVFAYSADGRRDPFFSLILTEDLRPLLSDLRLVGILYTTTGGRSVAIMRDLVTNAQYRVGTGSVLGRMRVAQIRPRAVIFSIDEFGLSRQDSLVLSDTTKVRN